MKVMTEEQHGIYVKIETIARQHSVPRADLMELVKVSFEAGQRDAAQSFASTVIEQANA